MDSTLIFSEEELCHIKAAKEITSRINELFEKEEEFYGFGLGLTIKATGYGDKSTVSNTSATNIYSYIEKKMYVILKQDISRKEIITIKLLDCFEKDSLDVMLDINAAGWNVGDSFTLIYYKSDNNMKKIEDLLIGQKLSKKIEANFLLEELIDKNQTNIKKMKI